METHQDFIDGYMDGYDLSAPFPSENRSARYIHSFWVGRREKSGRPIPYADIIKSLEKAEQEESNR